ncbi:helical backbone metal receptor [uncultured Jatrophihabitans sp.]|uniref:helical backbone metal receptor n=1 Tax=uncultured Jatrophihabitans sp. TaxID=1610747 RepID=UPI0035C95529
MGVEMDLPDDVRRVVSLVPSLSESIAVSIPDLLVGATDWCTHPADLDVARVRGTKNPDLDAIRELRPDLVVANKEENRELDVRRLRAAGVLVWVTDIQSVEQALRSLRRLFTEALRSDVPDWLVQGDAVWAAPPHSARLRVVIPIWRDPWMVVGPRTFTGDLAARLGLENVVADSPERYPHTTVEEIVSLRPDVVLLPDEPYVFSPEDGPEAFPELRCALVEGRALTWYGPSLATAVDTVRAALGLATG